MKPTKTWSEKGALMLAKCAEALALRKAFPQDLSGIYTPDEHRQQAEPAAPRATVSDFVVVSTANPQTDGGEYPVEDAASPPLTSEEQGIPEPDSPPSPITAAQMKALHAGLNAAGMSDRASGLAYISEEVGRTVTTSKDLTKDEASKVIDALHALALSVPEEHLPWVGES